ncbi:16039_t:CDS:2, partial [Funneliformis mosseae]
MSTSFYDDHYSSFSNVSIIRKVSPETSASLPPQVLLPLIKVLPIEDEELRKFRRLWWEEGNIHPQAKWEEAKLLYVIAKEITLDEYEKRTDEFNVH